MEYQFTDANFEQEVLGSDLPVLVDFYADWCMPCRMMAPVIKELAQKYEGRVKVGKLNIEENPKITERYRIMSIPCFQFFRDGENKESITGGTAKSEMEAAIERLLG